MPLTSPISYFVLRNPRKQGAEGRRRRIKEWGSSHMTKHFTGGHRKGHIQNDSFFFKVYFKHEKGKSCKNATQKKLEEKSYSLA